ncbi:YbaB/EbfC family nucleoid-associated protein [Actinoplanes sp. NPDC051494]|uniref:YbaB/EbfC family nucleoid-associated protein n=1 Tax=Actinoplanes sp. NPDC051494 TaxID=3363907 RepID=UPI0037AADB68
MSSSEFGSLGDQLQGVVEQLYQASERMQGALAGAQALTCTAASPSGLAEVTAAGRNRVVEIRLSTGHGGRADGELERVLVATLNEVLEQARAQSNAAMLDALPTSMRSGVQRAADEEKREQDR